MLPLFHIVKTNEYGLSGIANPTPGAGRVGYQQGSMHRATQSMGVGDCAITSGEVKLPEGYAEQTYQAEFLQFDLGIINLGEEWHLPDPVSNPELFISWPCGNASQKKQLKDFVLITLTDKDGNEVKKVGYPGLFFSDTFLPTNGVYQISNRHTFAGQRIQVNGIPDGVYTIDEIVNPIFGPSEPASVKVKFNGQDVELVPEEDAAFPKGLVWKKFVEKH